MPGAVSDHIVYTLFKPVCGTKHFCMNPFCDHNVALLRRQKKKKKRIYLSLVSDCVAVSGWSERTEFGSELMSRVNFTVEFCICVSQIVLGCIVSSSVSSCFF